MSIIEQIKAEVERQAKSIDTATGDFAEGRRMEQRIILSVLDTLQEKSEKPINPVCEGLEEEIKRYFEPISPSDIQYEPFIQMERCARHFYELGRQSKPKGSEDVEEAAENYAYGESDDKYQGFVDGASWQKEQMMKDCIHEVNQAYFRGIEVGKAEIMKEAVEGIAVINANAKEDGFGYVRSDYVSDDVLRGLGNFKLIIVKEEGK